MYWRRPVRCAVVMALVFVLLGCNDETSTANTSEETKTLTHIDISAPSSSVFTNLQFQAIGRYSDGSESDITGSVNWEISNSTVALIDDNGKVSPLAAGSIAVSAKLDGISSASNEITVVASIVCGHSFGGEYSEAVNDSNATNASGPCIKVAQDSSGNWFTGTPSLAAVDIVSYKNLDFAYWENGAYGPANSRFIRMNWFSTRDWCSTLSSIEFAGKSNWQMPTSSQLSGLYSDLGNLFTGYGWATYYSYHTSTLTADQYVDISLSTGVSTDVYPGEYDYSTCISVAN